MTATDGKYVASFAYDAWIEIFSPHNNIVCQDVASFAYDAWIEIKFIRSSLSEKGSHRLRTMRGLKYFWTQ